MILIKLIIKADKTKWKAISNISKTRYKWSKNTFFRCQKNCFKSCYLAKHLKKPEVNSETVILLELFAKTAKVWKLLIIFA